MIVVLICGLALIGAGIVALTLVPVALWDLFTKGNKALTALFLFAFTFAAVFCLWIGWHLLVS